MKKRIKPIKLLIMDVDGVLTDGRIVLDNEGNELKFFNVRDGHGIVMLHRIGVETAILTGRVSKVVERRAKELSISYVIQGSLNKLEAYEGLRDRLGLRDKEIAYVGDDVVDIPVMRRVGFAVAVADAHPEVVKVAHYVTKAEGGRGAVREVAELIIKEKGFWDRVMERYIK
ncbi:3-deoxy-D-manno-octulosonate 8-phosphate phosphatase [Thermosulfidibacter takaii ABI70S6]|uniref:3-deoxy-D-manno-octulosonate 8-phosphate phosphatase n=1 Tax=Thermosulfidibacter takaii (strain DSM 17441 / JCM 13301 / NBRC 103674 / ABI70S6) TaxID=1298851 RepID=A0A0S3QSC3_THET7|nr:3-deoxy-manno-octulosonate-8-phosphatase KdsC [Thermosulfidibacter takaii]BAT71247.1 3-deoxy-D-manno-octulosonate 8-phosphate phosphatase [Thermosulfidibacter takaii ABI70S6]